MNKSLENFFDQYQNIIETGTENAWSSRQITDTIYKNEFKNYIKKGLQPRLDEIRKVKGFVEFLRKSAEDTGSSGQTYIWRTENDGKTRPEHAAKEGQTFIWDEDENPGEGWGCRCRAEFLDGTLGRTKYDEDGNKFTQELKDKDESIAKLQENTRYGKNPITGKIDPNIEKDPTDSINSCGQYTREAINAAGFEIPGTNSAKNYGPLLERAGFEQINSESSGKLPDDYTPKKGDVMVFQSCDPVKRPHGHMQMFDGEKWISDFVQKTPWPGNGYLSDETPYAIYRSSDW